ncbi:hypothetical protein LRM48_002830 [Candidatus Nanosynbacter sp. TM7-008]|uniref:hypothetical protein n=1 Tax=Candidatus Nanosynbacter sp. TM7-008 TaxID=2902632 RepID=UPI001FB68627|nr:hypothetical protein [Candidatus Nanosynbacter sp. TM7-008]MCJ1964070.1 hypothetical protein [Candidatus Nanosynbacter sp. TM7-008]
MSDTDESYVEPRTIQLPQPSTEAIKNDANQPAASIETIKLSEDPQGPPAPSVDHEKKSL